MTADEIKTTVLRLIGEVAPEADLTRLKPDVSFREQLDIDSMDFLNLVIAIHETLHVEIPETDYAQVATLDGCVRYVLARVGPSSGRRSPA